MTHLPKLCYTSDGGNYISGVDAITVQFPTLITQIDQVELLAQQTGLEGEFRAQLKPLGQNSTGGMIGYYGPGQGPETPVRAESVNLFFVVPRLTLQVMSCQVAGVKFTPIMRSRANARSLLLAEIEDLIHQRGFQVKRAELEHVIPPIATVTIGFQAEFLAQVATQQLFEELRMSQL